MNEAFTSHPVRIVRTSLLGEKIVFAVDQPKDHIQRHHLQGRFYEPDELMIMSKVFPRGGRFLDIGANTGNHSIFFGKILKASHILPIEVNPRIVDLLKTNLFLNGLEDVCDLSCLGVGLHSEPIGMASVQYRERNIGGATVSYEGGDITLVKGDDVLKSSFDLVKIDVEGSEIEVLKGMSGFVSQFRPYLFIEVDNRNSEAFLSWVDDNNYSILEDFRRYKANCNYLLAPKR